MNSLILLAVVPTILKSIFSNTEMPLKKKQSRYIWFCAIFIILVMGLRTRYTGSFDTDIYCKMFEGVRRSGIGLIDFVRARTLDTEFLTSEGGFYVYTWILAKIFPSSQFFILVSAIIITFFVMRFIKLYSEDYEMSTVMYICLGLLTFNMNGMRQALAMAICLLAYEFIEKKKFFPFLLTILVATLFHKTAIVFLPFYLIRNIKFNFWHIAIFGVIIIGFYMLSDYFVEVFDEVMDKNYAGDESVDGGGYITVAIYILTIGVSLFYSDCLKNDNIRRCFFLTITGLCLYLARYFSVQIYERMSYFFFYYTIPLLPAAIKEAPEKEKILMRYGAIIMAILLFIYRASGGAFADFALFFNV